jgi:RNA polymerase sigma-70 factor, ECF subfamily
MPPEAAMAEALPPVSDANPCAEAPLIRATLAGDSRAFDAIIQLHSRRIYRFVHNLARQHHDAEDITQQTFIKAYRNLARFDPRRPMIHWLLTIARHTALNHFRDAKKWEEMPPEAASHEPSPARQMEHKDQQENLWDRARELLAPREFEILWLRFAEQLSTEETAQAVGLTTTHVKVLVHRARQTLLKGKEAL